MSQALVLIHKSVSKDGCRLIEKEYKYLVDQATFIHCKEIVGREYEQIEPHIQINYYYDNDELSLYHQNTTLRVRQKQGKLIQQKKTHQSQTKHCFISKEVNRAIDVFPAAIDGQYKIKGALVTHRKRYQYKDAVTIDFDTNYYLGVCDYEIEIEYLGGGEEEAKRLIHSLGLLQAAEVHSKSARFFKKWLSLFRQGN